MSIPENFQDPSRVREGTRGTFIIGALQIIMTLGVLVIAIIINNVLANADRRTPRTVNSDTSPRVRVVTPTQQSLTLLLRETGVVQARTTVSLTPQVTGRIIAKSPNLAAGGTFKAGEILFRIDPATTQAEVDEAEANLFTEQTDYDLEKAEAEIARREWRLLHPNEPVPALVAREPQLKQAEAAIAAAQATLNSARLDRGRVNFSLPYIGRVLTSSIEVGQTVTAGQNFGTVYAPDKLEISIPISARNLERIHPAEGRRVRIDITDASREESFMGQIVRIDGQLDATTRLARVFVQTQDPLTLPPGAFVNVEIEGPEIDDAYALPGSVLAENQTLWIVENGMLEARRPDILSNRGDTVITAPFDIGDGVVSTVMADPMDGRPVKILDVSP